MRSTSGPSRRRGRPPATTALRFDRRRISFPLRPAADQCGYRVFAPFLSPPPLTAQR